jgi:phospholipase/carboxylesterase
VRFVFPEGPLALDNVPFGGRAWWPIDMARLERAARTGDTARFLDETPAGLPEARKKLLSTLEALTTQLKLGMGSVVLGGFSQGAMLATDTTLRLEDAPAGLAIFSGTVVSSSEWTARAPKRAGLSVVQAHGTSDPILPYAAAEQLRDLLTHAGLRVRFLPFRGGHTITQESIAALAQLLQERLA